MLGVVPGVGGVAGLKGYCVVFFVGGAPSGVGCFEHYYCGAGGGGRSYQEVSEAAETGCAGDGLGFFRCEGQEWCGDYSQWGVWGAVAQGECGGCCEVGKPVVVWFLKAEQGCFGAQCEVGVLGAKWLRLVGSDYFSGGFSGACALQVDECEVDYDEGIEEYGGWYAKVFEFFGQWGNKVAYAY